MTQSLRYDFLNNPSLTPGTEAPSTTPDLSITRATSATVIDSNGIIHEVSSGVARFDGATYSGDVASGTSNGLLIEEARTNICLQSEDFGTTWTLGGNGAVNTNQAVSPDGSTTADQIIDDNSSGTGNVAIAQSVTVATETTYTYSAFLKEDQLSWGVLQVSSFTVPGNSEAWFNLSAGTVGMVDVGFDDSGIEDYGNGWYRCWVIFTTGASDTTGIVRIWATDADNNLTVDIDGTSSIYVWGAQLEAGTGGIDGGPSSYIPTTTSSVTRNADADITPANVTWANASQGTFYVRAKMGNVAAADQPLLEISDASTSDRIHVLCGATDGSLDLETDTTTGTDGDIAGTEDFTAGTFGRAAIGYANDDCIVYLDGTSGGTEASATLPPSETLTKFLIGSNQDGEYGNCIISEIRYYDERSNTLAENLSNGLFPIPDVVGLTESAATTLLEANGFVVATGVAVYSPTVALGSVVSQDDIAGAYVANGTTVTITLSLGPEPSGGRSKKGRKYSVEVDNEIFTFNTIAEAQEFLLLTKETAETAAQQELQRAEKTKTPVKVPRVRVKLITGKPSSSQALADAQAQAEQAIQEAYQKAAEARIQKLAEIARDIPGKGIQTRADMTRKEKQRRQKQLDELEALIALLL